jgi:hypothetical protein
MYLFFFLCGYLKSRVYFNRPNNLEDLWQRIRAEMEQISPDIIERGVQCQKLAGDNFNICVTFYC